MIPRTKVLDAAKKAQVINETIEETLKRQEKNDRRYRFWSYMTLSILLFVGVLGIWKQNQIAQKNQQHIDCIVKLFTTPLPTTARARTITNPSSTCNIKFTQ